MAKQLSTATTPLCLRFYRCRVYLLLISTYYDKPWGIRFDHYIGWFELDLLHVNITAAHVISVTRAHFAHYGVPDKFLSDNGPQYVSQEF